ncbi:FMN-binding negative transcriptional regulator [Tsuneonella sp. SYSU-LHT278]|uniref:FMN-binding negative transcriptional regulator n=1 Tax=Tsuneonella sediminis TaxID=3416089 RepID=UPI003F7AAF9B
MHPNPLFRSDDRALLRALVEEIGFGMVFAQTPDGPRVAHVPLVPVEGDFIQFHLSRGNAMTKWIAGGTALIVVNGPDAYVSPRWYADRATVPTWNYVALELEGRVERIGSDALDSQLHTLIERNEATLGGERWSASETPADTWRKLFGGIVGFEMEVVAWRPTLKLSQNKPAAEREAIAAGLEEAGSPALAQLMRTLGA